MCPRGSVLGPVLFLIYFNDLNDIVNFSKLHHFTDNTYILYTNNSSKDINKKINCDLKSIAEWLKANKISLNSGKTELVLSRSKNKKATKNMNFRLSGQKEKNLKKKMFMNFVTNN